MTDYPNLTEAARQHGMFQTERYASVEDLHVWACDIMFHRPPDQIIGQEPGRPDYLRRWLTIPKNRAGNSYLHLIGRSDDDRALHDHPWDNVSIIIDGRYIEHTPEGQFVRHPGDIVHRKATDRHRLELIDGAPVTSLFIVGPKIREWGFWCPQGFVHWRDFDAHGCS